MDAALEQGLELIYAIQALGSPALDSFFTAVTFLGDLEFYLLLAPVIIWCIDFGLGSRLGILFLLSGTINVVVKDAIMQPRPCEYDPSVCLDEAESYGLPSGHSQNAVVFWGAIADWIGSTWAWVGAIVLMVLIGFSRVYLGVHFPTDVLAGWLLGAVILGVYLGVGDRVADWLKRAGTAPQILLPIGIAVFFVAIDSDPTVVKAMAAFVGLGVGLSLTYRMLEFTAGGRIWKRVIRYLLGVAVIAIPFLRLGTDFEGVPLQVVVFGLIGLWIGFGAPWLFIKLRLAEPGSDVRREMA